MTMHIIGCTNSNLWTLVLLVSFCQFSEFAQGNICDYTLNADSVCCTGYSKNVYGDCVKSGCNQDCGNGRCVGLNVCECFDGRVTSGICRPAEIRERCPLDCSGRGECRPDGQCLCRASFSGKDCSAAEISSCYIKVDRGLCVSSPEGIQMSREECCSVFQVAWGNPCQFCDVSAIADCGRGFRRQEGQCKDIDECQINGICMNGQCINEYGSFRCLCPSGYTLKESSMTCSRKPDDPCRAGQCGPYGFCTRLDSINYRCRCRSPYVTSNDGRSCIQKNRFDVCKIYRDLCNPYGKCVSTDKSYFCNCRAGFYQSSDGKSCLVQRQGADNEQREARSSVCDSWSVKSRCRGGRCRSIGSNDYECECGSQFRVSASRKQCDPVVGGGGSTPIRPTKDKESPYCRMPKYISRCRGGRCVVDSDYGFRCVCLPGFKLTRDPRACEPEKVNPCTTSGAQCNGGRCVPMGNRDFRCECPVSMTTSADGRSCFYRYQEEKVDPCSTNGARCQGGRCVGIGKSDFRCECGRYMQTAPDRRSCFYESTRNYREYRKTSSNSYCNNPLYRNRCAGGQCSADPVYGFRCHCLPGFRETSDRRTCIKVEQVNPCITSGAQCNGGRCVAMGDRDFRCQCPSSMTASQDGRTCVKVTVENCSTQRQRCRGGPCFNVNYGYICICLGNYKTSEDGKDCEIKAYRPNMRRAVAMAVQKRSCMTSRGKTSSSCYPGSCQMTSHYPPLGRCICPVSFTSDWSGRSCDRDKNVCPTCVFGCWDSEPRVCSCPKDAQTLLDTGFCVFRVSSVEWRPVTKASSGWSQRTVRFSRLPFEGGDSNSLVSTVHSLLTPSSTEDSLILKTCAVLHHRTNRSTAEVECIFSRQ